MGEIRPVSARFRGPLLGLAGGDSPLLLPADEVRRELACRTLRTPGMSVGEAAFMVGFSDASAFHKAFRRWTGQSPSEYLRGS